MNWFGRRTVAGITASLTTIVSALRAHQVAMLAEVDKQEALSSKHRWLADEAHSEAGHATEIADKIGALLT